MNTPNTHKVISFCLWGDEPRYTIGAIRNAQLAAQYYSGFACWFYVHDSVPETVRNTLKEMENVVLIERTGVIKPNRFMAWRFEPYDDPNVELFISRDTDTRILEREVLAVYDWINSDKKVHIMRDSPCHYPVMLGGMFGMKRMPSTQSFNMKVEIDKYFDKHNDDDQCFLKNVVYPRIDSVMVHDEIKKYEKNCRDFSCKWGTDFRFVGGYVYEDESQSEEYKQVQKNYLTANLPHRISDAVPIKYCIISSDMNKAYYDFYPVVKQAWEKLGIETVFLLISNEIPVSLKRYCKDIVLFPPIDGVHTAFQAQCIRILYPCLIKTTNAVITSDIDLVPFQSRFFNKQVSNRDFLVFRDCISNFAQYPICYCAATPGAWKEVFQIETSKDIVDTIIKWYSAISDYKVSSPSSLGWACDQIMLFVKVNNASLSKKINLIKLVDENTEFKRHDRDEPFDGTKKFTDFHMPRPFSKYKQYIHAILAPTVPCIDSVFIVHYKKLKERREMMNKQLYNEMIYENYEVNWIDNFDREDLTKEDIQTNYRYRSELLPRGVTLGEIANGMCHNYIIESIAAREDDVCLILEDDAVLKPNFLRNLNSLLRKVPSDWEILTLGGPYHDEYLRINNDHTSPIVEVKPYQHDIVCTTVVCYLMKNKLARRIVNHSLFKPFSFPIDETLKWILPSIDAKIYWSQPWLAYEGTKTGLFVSSFPERGF